MNENSKPIIVALDFPQLDSALALVDQLDPSRCRVKVGKELFTRSGPRSVTALTERGFDVFLDLKFHDIPNTVAAASRAACDLGCWMFNVHASGGGPMIEAAVAALPDAPDRPLLIAVTVLTSMDADTLAKVGQDPDPTQQVLRLARLAEASGADGVVCSPLELGSLRNNCGESFAFVTPGVRPAGAASDDQRRVATPASALAAGASYLVIGRPITQAADPMQALAAIDRQCGQGAAEPQV